MPVRNPVKCSAVCSWSCWGPRSARRAPQGPAAARPCRGTVRRACGCAVAGTCSRSCRTSCRARRSAAAPRSSSQVPRASRDARRASDAAACATGACSRKRTAAGVCVRDRLKRKLNVRGDARASFGSRGHERALMPLPTNITGAPASGKGTQCEFIVQTFGVVCGVHVAPCRHPVRALRHSLRARHCALTPACHTVPPCVQRAKSPAKERTRPKLAE